MVLSSTETWGKEENELNGENKVLSAPPNPIVETALPLENSLRVKWIWLGGDLQKATNLAPKLNTVRFANICTL